MDVVSVFNDGMVLIAIDTSPAGAKGLPQAEPKPCGWACSPRRGQSCFAAPMSLVVDNEEHANASGVASKLDATGPEFDRRVRPPSKRAFQLIREVLNHGGP